MSDYSSSAALKGLAREHLNGNYGAAVRAYISMNITLLFVSWLSMSIFGNSFGGHVFSVILYLAYVMINGIFTGGCAYMYLNIASRQKVYGGMVFYCFKFQTDRAVIISLFEGMLEIGASLLFIASYSMYRAANDAVYFIPMGIGTIIMVAGHLLIHAIYMPAYYMIHDFPDYKAVDIIKTCPNITRKSIGRIIMLYISIIPLRLLELLSLGVAAPWAEAYVSAIFTECYLDLMKPGRAEKMMAQGKAAGTEQVAQ